MGINCGLTKEPEQSDEYALTGVRILLCEDNPLNQELMQTILESRGILVEIAENGEQGVELFTDSSVGYYQLILMDLRMPLLDGYAAAKQIRSMERSDAAGMDEHIAKTYSSKTIVFGADRFTASEYEGVVTG